MSDILYRSAFALAKDIKRGVLTSSGVLEFFLDRVDRFNPEINAVVQLDADRARERAAAADRAARRGEDLGPLHGVPLTIKDAYLTEGIVSANGMPEYRDNVPTRNSDAVQRYVDAGAIVFGKTNTPYASGDWQSFNSVYGTTGNPWDSARTCGGSSGGAGAALAAGMTPLELGGDIGGSIRIPAHFNGVFGHKPSHGIVSQRNVVDWQEQLGEQDLWVVGPMGITARDVRDALRLLVGATAEKAVAWRVELPAARTTDVSKLRVATCFERPDYPVDAEVLALLQGVARTLAECGARVDHDTVPGIDFDENFSLYLQLMYSHMGEDTPEKIRQGMAAMLRPLARGEEIVAAMGSSLTRWLAVHERRLQLQRKWVEFFEDYDVLLAPVLPLPAFVHDQRPMGKRTWAINGIERIMMFDVLFLGRLLAGHLPARHGGPGGPHPCQPPRRDPDRRPVPGRRDAPRGGGDARGAPRPVRAAARLRVTAGSATREAVRCAPPAGRGVREPCRWRATWTRASAPPWTPRTSRRNLSR